MAGRARHLSMDTPVEYAGDNGFLGINSYKEPEVLQPGELQTGQNIRIDGNKITTRNGWDFLAGLSGISPAYTYSDGVEQVFVSGLYSDPDDDNKNWLVAATKFAAIIWDGTTPYYVNYPTFTISNSDINTSNDEISKHSHNLETGTAVVLTTTGALPSGLSVGTTYYVIKHNTNTFKLATSLANAKAGTNIDITGSPEAGSGTHTVKVALVNDRNMTIVQAFNNVYLFAEHYRPLVWDGNTTATGSTINSSFALLSETASGSGDQFPSTGVAKYFNERMIGIQPAETATPTQNVTGAQTVVMSDLLDVNNITSTDSEFYINQGSADWVVGFASYLDHQLVVFNRRSIHMIINVHATSVAERQVIQERYGCVARRSIAQGGGYIFFLSDDGVFTLSPAQDAVTGMGLTVSKLQGAAVPLSSSIQDEIDSLNFSESVISLAAGVVHDNKYYLAIGTTVLIYDMLNTMWVSKDTYPEAIIDWVVMPYSTGIRLFAITKTGWYMMNQNDGTDDSGREIGSTSESGTTAIPAKFITRDYHAGDNVVKKFNQVKLMTDLDNGDAFTAKVNTKNPDTTSTVITHTSSSTETKVLKARNRSRGFACNLEVDVTAGSPAFRRIEVSAIPYGGNNQRNTE